MCSPRLRPGPGRDATDNTTGVIVMVHVESAEVRVEREERQDGFLGERAAARERDEHPRGGYGPGVRDWCVT